jgi:maltose O-acetyltransferase
VTIGDRVWIGSDAVVLRGVTIGDDVVVGAGSIVTKDIPSRTLALGAPAKPIRDLAIRTDCQ